VTSDLAAIAARAEQTGRLGVDTEFMSERRYRALLCLVQMAVGDPADPEIHVVDALADLDASPIARVLGDPEIEVVVHAGRQDVALLKRVWRSEVRNVFDTQVAGAFLGFGPQAGYSVLVDRVLNRRTTRDEGLTRWDRRPLSEDQLEYARADVEHLLALADELEGQLERLQRIEWVREECRALELSSDLRDVDDLFWRLPRLNRLSAKQRAVARELLTWRERTAAELDRPAKRLLPEQVLVELARRSPSTREELAQVRAVPEQTLHRQWRGIVEAVERGSRAEPIAGRESYASDARDAPLIALAQAVVRQRALDHELAPELLATQGDLAALVGDLRRGGTGDGSRALEGWRRELVGQELLDLIGGRRSLAVGPDRRLRLKPNDSGQPSGNAT
jgi:ribonuclease D